MAAAELEGGLTRTQKRRSLRQAHGGRLRQALYVVDLQLRGIRAALHSLEQRAAVEVADPGPSWSREQLLRRRSVGAAGTLAAAADRPGSGPELSEVLHIAAAHTAALQQVDPSTSVAVGAPVRPPGAAPQWTREQLLQVRVVSAAATVTAAAADAATSATRGGPKHSKVPQNTSCRDWRSMSHEPLLNN
jgi:hypothetical protein